MVSQNLTVELSFRPKNNIVGVTIKSGHKFVLSGNLRPAEAASFMNFVLYDDLTDNELEARARRYGLKAPVR